jgi:hypothetical protein
MIKRIIYRIIKYFFGIDILKLLSNSQMLQSSNSSLKQKYAKLEQQIISQREQLNHADNLLIASKNELENLKTENVEIKSNMTQVLTSMQTLKMKFDEENQLTQKITIEKEKLEEKIQTEIDTKLSVQSQLKDVESKYVVQKNAINDLQGQIASYKESKSKQLEIIRNLKEVISQLQSEAVNFKLKDEIIEKLRKNVDDGTGQISNLQSKLEELQNEIDKSKPPVITHTKQQLKKTLQKIDGIVVEHKGLNVGIRSKKRPEKDGNDFNYLGNFLFNLWQYNKQDSENFPDVFYPKLKTPILKWHKAKSNTTTGIAEPLLAEDIKSIKKLAPDIKILQNITLSIRNRDYSYRPDLALFWQKHNLCIDIEIDEPYDIVSRKPIHYMGSSDYLRNLYFVSQGWVVIRFSEKQVVENTADCIKYVAYILKKITGELIFETFIELYKPEYAQRWSYLQAEEYAIENYREKYLGIETAKKIYDLESIFFDESPFFGNPPAEDILPEVDYSILEKKLSEIQNQYIRITKYPFEDQLILENFKCEKKNYKKCISGFDLVEETNSFIPFDLIFDIDGMDSQFIYPLYDNSGDGSDEKLRKLVKEAIYGCYPIRMEYRDAYANITFRNIVMVSFVSDSKEYFGDEMWANYYKEKGSLIVAFCELRKAQRHFYIDRIQAIQIFDVRFLGIGHIISFSTALWDPLMKNDLMLCKQISNLIPNYLKETDLVTVGNYAHYLLLSGRKDDALEIYRKFEGKKVNKELTWRNMNLLDFKSLSNVEDYKEKIDEAIDILGWANSNDRN